MDAFQTEDVGRKREEGRQEKSPTGMGLQSEDAGVVVASGACRPRFSSAGGRTHKKKRELPRAFKGSRTPGNNRYRCFLSDLTGLAA